MNIINFGSLNIDYVYSVEHIVREGETIETNGRALFPGGKGLNQSVALSRAGTAVYHAGCVGDDGAYLTDYLGDNGVDISCVSRASCATGHAIIQVDKSGQNSIFLFGGSNQAVTEAQIDSTLSKFHPGDILLLQNEISNVGYLIRKGSELGLTIAFNPAPFTQEVMSYPLEKVDYLFLNEIEAAAVIENHHGTVEQSTTELERRYPGVTIVITMGKDGAVLLHHGERVYQKAFQVEAVDTTGAGDTFVGYFLSCVTKGYNSEDRLLFATAASALAVSRHGAAPSIPYFEEVKKWLE